MNIVSLRSAQWFFLAFVIAVLSSFVNQALAAQKAMTTDQMAKLISTLDLNYASGAIISAERAEKALTDVAMTKKELQWWFERSELDCYEYFFVNVCLNEIKLTRRHHAGILQRISVEAKAWQRKFRIQQLDQRVEAKASSSK